MHAGKNYFTWTDSTCVFSIDISWMDKMTVLQSTLTEVLTVHIACWNMNINKRTPTKIL